MGEARALQHSIHDILQPKEEEGGRLQQARCSVCSQPMEKERLHYGGYSCYSCRAFFRRKIQSGKFHKLCSRGGQCNVSEWRRRNCVPCRYASCLEAGMKPELVLSEEKKEQRFWKKIEKERLQQTGANAAGGLPSPSSKRRQKSKLNYLLRYCPPAAAAAAAAMLANDQRSQAAMSLPAHFNYSLGGGNLDPASGNRILGLASGNCGDNCLAGDQSSDGVTTDRHPKREQSPPPLIAIHPSTAISTHKTDRSAPVSPMPLLPLIRAKKKHDLYGKSSGEIEEDRSAYWPLFKTKEEEPSAEEEGSSDMAATLFPVGRQVKFKIFDWNEAAAIPTAAAASTAAAAERMRMEVEPPVQLPLLPCWLPLNTAGPPSGLASELSQPALSPRLFNNAAVKPEPDPCDYAALAADPCRHPEIWRQLRLHQLKMEVLSHVSSSSLSFQNHNGHSGDSGCTSSSNSSSRSNSCQLMPNEEDVEEDEEDKPLDFSLTALGRGGSAATQVRQYSVIMSPWKQ